MKDCENGTDEMNCTKESVKCDGFLCQNFECIPKRWKCDGIPDCDDNSDEQNCTQPKNQICDKEHGFYKCLTGECISHFKVCDNHKDCPQGDDEGTECKSNGCHTKNCSQLCFIAPHGPQCYCREGFVIDKDNTTCIDKDECLDNRNAGHCSQSCVNLDGSYKCECFDDYQLVNNKSCVVKEGEPLLLFSNSEGIRGIWLKSDRYFPVYHSLRQTVGLDFMGAEQRVYWVDLDKTHSGVYSVGILGEDFKPIVTNGFKSPEDIAIDWIGGNFYVTDAELNRIVVCRLSGDMCSSTLFGEVDLPRAIAVDPSHGTIFWTEWGSKAGVYKAGMDGSNKVHLVKTGVVWPNGLALDSVANRLYWTEAKEGKLEFLDLTTNQRHVVIQDKVFHPFSLDVFEEWMYWSDWTTYSLERSHKFSGHNRTTLIKEISEHIMGVHIYHPLKHKSSYNPCWYHTCSHMCVLSPKRQFACACPDHMVLSLDKQNCVGKPNEPFLLVGVSQDIKILYSEAIGNDVMIAVDLPKGLNVGGFAYNWNSKTIYIFDSKRLEIGSIEMNNSINHYWNPIITSGLDRIEGLTYDIHTNQLYWLETKEGILEVSTIDGMSRALLLKDLDKPIDLALFPEHRKMYIAVMGTNPHILESDMDGQNRKVLVTSKNGFAVSLAIDTIHSKLFWADAKNGLIEWLDLLAPKSSLTRKGVVKRNLGHVMSIAAHNKTLFWTDMDSDILYHETFGVSAPRHSKVVINVKHQGKVEKKLMFAFPQNKSHGPCSVSNGGCSHICLLGRFTATCMCPFGYELQSNGQTCEKRTDVTDNNVICTDCVTSADNSEDLGFIAFDNSEDEDLNWFLTDEDEEADMLFSRYDSKHKINESHNVNANNDSSYHLMTTQTEVTTRPSTPVTAQTTTKRKQKAGHKTKQNTPKVQDLTDKIKDKILVTIDQKEDVKKGREGTESSILISNSGNEANNDRKKWLTLTIAVLIVGIIVLLITIIIRRDDYRYENLFSIIAIHIN